MTAQPLTVHVRHQPRVAIIDVQGRIDAYAEEALQSAYGEAGANQPGAILLNLSRVEYINSSGIALIVQLLRQEREAGRRLLACGASDHYQEIFRVTRLIDFMGLFPDEASALAAASAV